jgi:hypothetical protein
MGEVFNLAEIRQSGGYFGVRDAFLADSFANLASERPTRWEDGVRGAALASQRRATSLIPYKRTWTEFYAGRDTKQYRDYVRKQYAPFIDAVTREIFPLAQHCPVILEVGSGLCTVTQLIEPYTCTSTLVCMDIDQEMVRQTRVTMRDRAHVIHADMRTASWIRADVIHGHGVLEHLSDASIARTLAAHKASGAKVAIHYVPGEKHKAPSFGDERLMPFGWWIDKFNPTEAFEFNDGKDYVLIWRF